MRLSQFRLLNSGQRATIRSRTYGKTRLHSTPSAARAGCRNPAELVLDAISISAAAAAKPLRSQVMPARPTRSVIWRQPMLLSLALQPCRMISPTSTAECNGQVTAHPLPSRNRLIFAATHMSAFGTKRTSGRAQSMSAFGGKADIGSILCDVRF